MELIKKNQWIDPDRKTPLAMFQCPACGKKKILSFYEGHSRETCGCNEPDIPGGHSRLYSIWSRMISVCYRSNSPYYLENFRIIGVKVADDWRHSYPVFKEWALDNGYTGKNFLTRKDKNMEFNQMNCYFTDKMEGAV